jgi:hypothetical protein
MPQTLHVERHFTGSATVRDIVIGMSDGLTVPYSNAASSEQQMPLRKLQDRLDEYENGVGHRLLVMRLSKQLREWTRGQCPT